MTYINDNPPIYFISGSLMDPNDVNENFLYVKKSLDEVGKKRFEHTVLVLPFLSGTRGSDNKECRSIRFPALNSMLLERVYLNFNGTGSVQIKIFKSDAPVGTDSDIPGVPNPILKADSTDETVDVKDIFTTQLLLTSGSTYRLELTGTIPNQWMANRADLILHLRSDRFFTGSVEHGSDPTVTLFTEDDTVSATTYLTNRNGLFSASVVNVTNSQQALKPIFIDFRNVDFNSNVSVFTQNIPVGNSNQVRMTSVGLSMFSVSTGSAQSSNALTYTLANSNGVSQATLINTMASAKTGSYAEVRFSAVMGSTSSNPATDTSKDWRLSITSMPTYKQFRSYGYLWIK